MSPIELRARREALGLNQSDLAAVLRVGQNTVSQWETGKRPIGGDVDDELTDLEESVERIADLACRAIESAHRSGIPGAVLYGYRLDRQLWAEIPETDGLPVVVHRVALARARRLAKVPSAYSVTVEEKPMNRLA